MIKKFKEEDAKRCSEIMLDCIDKNLNYERENRNFMIKMSSPENIIKKARNTDFFVLFDKGIIIATGVFDQNEIRTMFVDPKYQGKGYGKKMLEFLINLAIEKGYDLVHLNASPEAEAFYLKQGFKTTGEKNDFNFRTILMEKKLKN